MAIWQDDGFAKGHPDRHPTRHEVHASMHAADEDRIVDAFVDPANGPGAAEQVGPAADEADKLLPEMLDELDHAGLDVELPDDHPGGTVEEQVKGLPARWGKARP